MTIVSDQEIPDSLFKFYPPNNTSFWCLSEKYFYFAPLSQLNDPFELRCGVNYGKNSIDGYLVEGGRLHNATIQHFVEFYEMLNNDAKMQTEIREEMDRFVKAQLDIVQGIFSLSLNLRSPTQWAHYTSNHQGWVVEIDPHNIFDEDALLLKCKYEDSPPLLDFSKLNTSERNARKFMRFFDPMLSTKCKDWNYEEEFRFIQANRAGVERTQKVTFNPSGIKGIYFGKDIDPENRLMIHRLTSHWNVNYFDMSVHQSKYEMVPNAVTFD